VEYYNELFMVKQVQLILYLVHELPFMVFSSVLFVAQDGQDSVSGKLLNMLSLFSFSVCVVLHVLHVMQFLL